MVSPTSILGRAVAYERHRIPTYRGLRQWELNQFWSIVSRLRDGWTIPEIEATA